MTIVLAGGSGQVGQVLARALHHKHAITILSRSQSNNINYPNVTTVQWDAKNLGAWAEVIDGADVVINLAGKTVNCRYTEANKQEMMASRVDSTRAIGEAIARASRPPALWLQACTATIYKHSVEKANDETTGVISSDADDAHSPWGYSVQIAKAWERTVDEANTPQTRKIKLRSGMIMSPDRGGVFATLLNLVRLGLGGSVAGGKQYISWIHEVDFVSSLIWLIENDTMEGVVNISAPHPLPYGDFMRALRQAWGMPFGLPASAWMLEIGAFVLRTESELVLKSRRVVPARLLEAGFTFAYPHWHEAAEELCARWRETYQ